jgi:hypothetical protein
VRRSVANNLNDIGKDHPGLLITTACRWLVNATEPRQWIIRRALRSLIKEGNPDALALMGCRPSARLIVGEALVTPARTVRGESVRLKFHVANTGPRTIKVIIDFRVHYVKASGKTSAKVFKLSTALLPARHTILFQKALSLKDLTTRQHHPGHHRIEALINGTAHPIGSFELLR